MRTATIVCTAIISLLTPASFQYALAGESDGTGHRLQFKNVELDAHGGLHGQILTSAGQPVTAERASISRADQVHRTQTDGDGSFLVSGLESGVCLIETADGTFACRVWKHGTAPPKSLESVVIVVGNTVVRGQNCDQNCPDQRRQLHRLSTEQKYGLATTALFGTALVMALDRDAS